ncbi:MAG: outer membrane beta-barrel protein [Pseudobdellovibrionaceae bacterium]
MKSLFSFFLLIFSLTAQAQMEFGLVGGLQSGQAETDLSGASAKTRLGYHFGGLAYLPLQKSWGLRSGLIYNQRYTTLEPTLSGKVDMDFAYFDVPLTPMLKFSGAGGVFAGPVLAFNQSKDVTCSQRANCAAVDVKSFLLPLQVGVQFRFLPQMGAELFFEYISGELATNVSNMKTVGASFLFYFE